MLALQRERGDRSNAPNVAVLITDGPSNKNSWQTVPTAESARNAGINIFVIGVGSQVDPVEMKGIAGSKDRMSYVWSFDEMLKDSTMKMMYSKICSTCPRCYEIYVQNQKVLE